MDYFGFTADLPTLTVTGGSKGARTINTALMKVLPQLLKKMQIIHLTGHLDWEVLDEQAQKLPPTWQRTIRPSLTCTRWVLPLLQPT